MNQQQPEITEPADTTSSDVAAQREAELLRQTAQELPEISPEDAQYW